MTQPIPLPAPLPRLVVGSNDLRLELWRADAVEEVVALVEHSRDSLSAFLPWANEPQPPEAEAVIQAESTKRWEAGLMAGWMIVEDREIRGMLGLHRRGGPDEAELGYWLDDEATGRGLMTTACTMATDVAFGIDAIDVVEIVHDANNHRSAAVPARLGFSRTAAYTAPAQARCESGIKVRWCVRRDEWQARGRPSTVLHAE